MSGLIPMDTLVRAAECLLLLSALENHGLSSDRAPGPPKAVSTNLVRFPRTFPPTPRRRTQLIVL